jgi:hypothetical protein
MNFPFIEAAAAPETFIGRFRQLLRREEINRGADRPVVQ